MVLPTRSTPEDGDLVVRQDIRDGEAVYVFHTAHRADQYLLRSRADAIAQAIAFARRQRMRVWLTDGDTSVALVEDFRNVPHR